MKTKLFFIVAFALIACDNSSLVTQKPRGYFKIDLPEKKYQKFDKAVSTLKY